MIKYTNKHFKIHRELHRNELANSIEYHKYKFENEINTFNDKQF